jgi:hypothetical protein
MSDTAPTPETDRIMDNVRVAVEADSREQSFAYIEEVRREVESLERERDEARAEVARLRELVGRLDRIVCGWHPVYRNTELGQEVKHALAAVRGETTKEEAK